MKKIAFKMLLNTGEVEEYTKRYDAIWPELKALLIDSGIYDYSIYFDETSHSLFAVVFVKNSFHNHLLSENEILRKWWDYMSDIMETELDNSPLTHKLEEVFNLVS